MPSEYYTRVQKAVYDIGFYFDSLQDEQGYDISEIRDALWWLSDIYEDMAKHAEQEELNDD